MTTTKIKLKKITMKNLTFALLGILSIALCSFAVLTVNSTDNTVNPKVYKKFLSKFDKVDLPYTLASKRPTTYAELQNQDEARNQEKYLGGEFENVLPEMQRGRYSRMGPDDFNAEVMLTSNQNFDAIIYSRTPSFRGGKTYYVATFEKSGKMIMKTSIARVGYGQLEEAHISADLTIQVDRFKIESSDGYDDDAALTYHLEDSREIMINPNGNIIENAKKEAPTQQKKIQLFDLGMAD
jgi:hypothetical protein